MSVQSSQLHCMIPQIGSSIHHQQGSLLFLSLDISQTECQSSVEDPSELPSNISLLFLSSYFYGVKRSRKKANTQGVVLFFGLKLTNPLLVSASNSLPILHATSKATII